MDMIAASVNRDAMAWHTVSEGRRERGIGGGYKVIVETVRGIQLCYEDEER
jgi:hypothetical protein